DVRCDFRVSGFFRMSAFVIRNCPGVVRQLHHVVEISRRLIAPDMEDVHLAFVQARDRLEFLDPFKLPLERPIMLELVPVNDFDGAKFAQHVSSQPHFAIAAAADAAKQLVIGNGWDAVLDHWSRGVVRTVARARFSRAACSLLFGTESNAAVRRFVRWRVRVHGNPTLYPRDGKMHSNMSEAPPTYP